MSPDQTSRPALALLLLASLVLTASHAAAAGKPSAKQRAAVLQAIVDCRAMTDTSQRLACFDAAAAKLDEAESSGDVVVVDKQQARQVRREIFGLQLPSLDVFGGARPSALGVEDVDRISEKVKRASQASDGRWTVELESGAVWRQTDAFALTRPARPGSTAEIRKASLGSFFMRIDGQPGFKAHRDR